MSEELKKKLIDAGRILASEGQGDLIWGHVTARHPDDPNLLLMKPASIGLEEMTPENIGTVNIEGEKVDGPLPRHLEVFIHSEIMRARPDINAVVHTHPPHAVIFSSLGTPLVPVGHSGTLFSEQLPVFSETTDLIVTQARGRSVARTLGTANALLLRNHGIVTAGKTIEEAIFFALHLEAACEMQLMAMACGGPKDVTQPEEARIKGAGLNNTNAHRNIFNYLVRRGKRRS